MPTTEGTAMQDTIPTNPADNGPGTRTRQHRHVGLILFEGVEELDAVGPREVLSHRDLTHPEDGWKISCLAANGEPVAGAKGLVIAAHHSIGTAPQLDVIIHPGGPGTRPMLHDPGHLNWIRSQREVEPLI